MPARRARIDANSANARDFVPGVDASARRAPATAQLSNWTWEAGTPLAAHGAVSTIRAALTEPMYATLGHGMPRGAGWTYEPKYDGMRVIAEASSRQVRLMTRNGKDKQAQFPEVVGALRSLASRAGVSVVLDGEVVARRRRQKATRSVVATSGFQPLQARMHLKKAEEIARLIVEAPATLVAFDLLREGRTSLVNRPWSERRERLEALFAGASDGDAALVLGETSTRGATMLARARRGGWEGIIAKRTDVRYQAGSRSDDWLKLKLQFRAEFVVGGFTEPRKTRPFLGALLLGAYDSAGRFQYVGHMGGGFNRDGLRADARAPGEDRATHLSLHEHAADQRAGALGRAERRRRSEVRRVDGRRTVAPTDLPRGARRQVSARCDDRKREHAALGHRRDRA